MYNKNILICSAIPATVKSQPDISGEREALYPMIITTIDPKNEAVFADLIPEDLFEKMKLPSVFALGAIAEEEQRTAGVLLFSVEEGVSGEEELIVATLLWLYVAPSYRGTGAADLLMETFWDVMDKSGVENILCDVPMSEEYNELCAYLESWGFQFFLWDQYELTVQLQDFLELPALKGKPGAGIKPLRMVDKADFRRFLDRVRMLPGVLQELPEISSAYEEDVSCVHMDDMGIDGALLVQKTSSGTLEVLLFRALSNQQQNMGMLARYSLGAAVEKYSPETPVHFVCRLEAMANVIDKMFPDASPLLVRRGCYYNGPEGPEMEEETEAAEEEAETEE